MLSDRLREQRLESENTQESVARFMGVSQQTIGSWETGRTSPDNESLKILANFFNCSTDWLLNKTLDDFRSLLQKIISENELSPPELSAMIQVDRATIDGIISGKTCITYNKFKSLINKMISLAPKERPEHVLNRYFFDITPFATDFYKQEPVALKVCEEVNNAKYADAALGFIAGTSDVFKSRMTMSQNKTAVIPIIGTVKAGLNGISFEEHLGYHDVSVESLPASAQFFCLKVRGDSMSPYLLPGDLVLFHENPDVPSGSLAIVIVDGEEGTVKWLRRGEQYIKLEAENPYYPPREFSGEELRNIRIVGPVLEVIRKPVKKNGIMSKS